MKLSNIPKKYKVFQEQPIGLRLKLNIKVPVGYNNNKKRQPNKFNQVEGSYTLEDQLDLNSCIKRKCKTGKINLDQ